ELDETLGLGGALATAVPTVAGLTDQLNDALSPLVGSEFDPDDPNALDPLDEFGVAVADDVGELLSPVIDELLGSGVTSSVLGPVAGQVDYITDAVSNLLTEGLLSDVVDTLGLGGLLDGLLGESSDLSGVLDDVVGPDSLAGGLIEEDGLVDELLEESGLVGGLLAEGSL